MNLFKNIINFIIINMWKFLFLIIIVFLTSCQLNCCPFTLVLISEVLKKLSKNMEKRDESINGMIIQLLFTAMVAYYEFHPDYQQDVSSKDKIEQNENNIEFKNMDDFLNKVNKETNLNESSQSSEDEINNDNN